MSEAIGKAQQPLKREERPRRAVRRVPELCLCWVEPHRQLQSTFSQRPLGHQNSSLLLHSVCGEFGTQGGTYNYLYVGHTSLAGNGFLRKAVTFKSMIYNIYTYVSCPDLSLEFQVQVLKAGSLHTKPVDPHTSRGCRAQSTEGETEGVRGKGSTNGLGTQVLSVRAGHKPRVPYKPLSQRSQKSFHQTGTLGPCPRADATEG